MPQHTVRERRKASGAKTLAHEKKYDRIETRKEETATAAHPLMNVFITKAVH